MILSVRQIYHWNCIEITYGVFDIKKEPEKNKGNYRVLLRTRIESGYENSLGTCINCNVKNETIEVCDEIIIKN